MPYFNSSQIIIVSQLKETNRATLMFYNKSNKIFETRAFIGENGITSNKIEGDGKTPKGVFELGLVFGIHSKEEICLNSNIEYFKINQNLYWVDDIKSKYYNQLVDIAKVNKDWNSAEHLIEYPKQYEYAIEIKANPKDIPGKRKRNIFALQCR